MYKVKRFSRYIESLIGNNKNFLKRNINKTIDEVGKTSDKVESLTKEIRSRGLSPKDADKRIKRVRQAANRRSDRLIDSIKGSKSEPSKLGVRLENYIRSN